jgi:homoserine O-succinyltransferase
MPLHIDAYDPPARRGRESHRRTASRRDARTVVIGLINNMPDTALAATESQFRRLLETASGSLPVRLRTSCLPEVPRSAAALERVRRTYWPIAALLEHPLDALIITGAEPIAPRLEAEPYWDRLRVLIEWAETHTTSSLWSCLAAHAAVQILDGIERQRRSEKCCGVFEHALEARHPLMQGIAAPLRIPHSRWNELPVAALRRSGYALLSASPDTGADIFVKQGRSLLVFCQGHPEYECDTLLKEYRRDVGRFLRAEQTNYPTLPSGYFDAAATVRLDGFRERALAQRTPELLTSFPSGAVAHGLEDSWGVAAVQIYRNWLDLLAAAKQPARSVSEAVL